MEGVLGINNYGVRDGSRKEQRVAKAAIRGRAQQAYPLNDAAQESHSRSSHRAKSLRPCMPLDPGCLWEGHVHERGISLQQGQFQGRQPSATGRLHSQQASRAHTSALKGNLHSNMAPTMPSSGGLPLTGRPWETWRSW